MHYLNEPEQDEQLSYKAAEFILKDHSIPTDLIETDGVKTHMMLDSYSKNGIICDEWIPVIKVYSELMAWLGH